MKRGESVVQELSILHACVHVLVEVSLNITEEVRKAKPTACAARTTTIVAYTARTSTFAHLSASSLSLRCFISS
jgi:hypothetical protein